VLGSCINRPRTTPHSRERGQAIFYPPGWSGWNELRRPSRAFLTALAASVFAGALLLTPPVPVATSRVRSGGLALGPSAASSRAALVLDSTTWEREVVARYDHLPLAQILSNSAEPALANRVARAIVKEARELQLSPSLLAGVLLTENARLEPATISHRGAVGLMQVMRFHAGVFDCDSDDLLQVEANICHGARVFAGYLKRTKDVRSALLRYNGCVKTRATSSCRRYPSKVLRQANQIRHQLLLYLPPKQLSAVGSSSPAL
jgi:soluble lytic murein transglycosylase-like protein